MARFRRIKGWPPVRAGLVEPGHTRWAVNPTYLYWQKAFRALYFLLYDECKCGPVFGDGTDPLHGPPSADRFPRVEQ